MKTLCLLAMLLGLSACASYPPAKATGPNGALEGRNAARRAAYTQANGQMWASY